MAMVASSWGSGCRLIFIFISLLEADRKVTTGVNKCATMHCNRELIAITVTVCLNFKSSELSLYELECMPAFMRVTKIKA